MQPKWFLAASLPLFMVACTLSSPQTKVLLFQVFDNLLSNAIKYSPPEKTVTIQLVEEREYLTIIFRDQGLGIALQEQPLLFKTFSRLSSRPTQGEASVGLGLSIVKRLVTMMEGEVWCKSALGQGSDFGVAFKKFSA